MPYTVHKWGAIGILVAYLFFGWMSDIKEPPYERYPFFNWQLFSYIPNPKDDFSIEVYRIGEYVYDPPLQYSEMRELFRSVDADPTEYLPIIRQLAGAVRDNDHRSMAQHRASLEAIFRGQPFSYGVLSVHLDPITYWETGTYEEMRVMAVFTSDE